jgi:hypothetical protein
MAAAPRHPEPSLLPWDSRKINAEDGLGRDPLAFPAGVV